MSNILSHGGVQAAAACPHNTPLEKRLSAEIAVPTRSLSAPATLGGARKGTPRKAPALAVHAPPLPSVESVSYPGSPQLSQSDATTSSFKGSLNPSFLGAAASNLSASFPPASSSRTADSIFKDFLTLEPSTSNASALTPSAANTLSSGLLPSNPSSSNHTPLDHTSSHHGLQNREAGGAASNISAKGAGKRPVAGLLSIHTDMQPSESGPPSSIGSAGDDTSLVSVGAVPAESSSTETFIPQPPQPVPLRKLINRYALKFDKKLSLRDETDKRFAPAGTARDFFDDNRIEKLVRALVKAQSDLNGDRDEARNEWVKRLVFKINGQGAGQGLHNILATLVFIRCGRRCLLAFLEADDTIPNDESLPFPLETAINRFGEEYGWRFYHDQYIFTPFTFTEGQENRCYSRVGEPRRLPILERKWKGGGAYGDVFELEIEKGGWRFPDGSTNKEPKRIAQKVFKGDFWQEERRVFLDERDIHLQIGQDCTSHKHLVHCLGSLEQPDRYSLFFDLADGNLEDFLLDQDQKRDTPAVILARSAEVCGGLDHLHHGLSRNGNRIFGYHLDFRPQNILIYGDLWKVADFGLSRLKDHKPGSDAFPDFTPNRRGDGTFVAPEASLKGVSSISDLWSLAAVLIEVLTCAIGGPDLVKEFREARKTDQGHDKFFVEKDGTALVNKRMTRWCQKLRGIAAAKDRTLGEVVNETVAFLEQKVLVIDVEERRQTSANDISIMLYKMSERLKEATKRQTTPRLSGQEALPTTTTTTMSEPSPKPAPHTTDTATPVTARPKSRKQSSCKKLTSLHFWSSSLELLCYYKNVRKYDTSTFALASGGAHMLSLSADTRTLDVYSFRRQFYQQRTIAGWILP